MIFTSNNNPDKTIKPKPELEPAIPMGIANGQLNLAKDSN